MLFVIKQASRTAAPPQQLGRLRKAMLARGWFCRETRVESGGRGCTPGAFLLAPAGLACSNLRIVALMAHPAWTACRTLRSPCRPSSAPWAVTAQMSPVPHHCSATAVVSPSRSCLPRQRVERYLSGAESQPPCQHPKHTVGSQHACVMSSMSHFVSF